MFKIILTALMLFFSVTTQASNFKEGVHYFTLEEAIPSKQNEIRIYFSFWCNHCFALEDTFDAMANVYKDKVNVVYNSTAILGGDLEKLAQAAVAVATQLKVEQKFINALFVKMHKENKLFRSHEELASLMKDTCNIDTETYFKYLNNQVTSSLIKDWNNKVDENHIDAIPRLIVNNKYVINFEPFETIEEIYPLFDELMKLEK